jgi:Abnormal spindle-like microcephaly-assoc'd, ASPM-SPD-2-Hydin
MLRGMNRSGSARAQFFSGTGRTFRLLLVSAALMTALYQSGCSGVTAQNAILSGVFHAGVSNLVLGNVALGDSKTLTLTFTNSSNTQVTISNISISGPGFSLSGISSGTNFSPGQTAVLNVTFTPASVGNAAGSITATTPTSTITVSLQAAGVPAGDHSAALSWNSSSPVIGYFIYRGTSSAGPYTRLNSSPNTNTAYTDSSVQAGQSYYYVVTGVNSSNVESPFSNEVVAAIPSP